MVKLESWMVSTRSSTSPDSVVLILLRMVSRKRLAPVLGFSGFENPSLLLIVVSHIGDPGPAGDESYREILTRVVKIENSSNFSNRKNFVDDKPQMPVACVLQQQNAALKLSAHSISTRNFNALQNSSTGEQHCLLTSCSSKLQNSRCCPS